MKFADWSQVTLLSHFTFHCKLKCQIWNRSGKLHFWSQFTYKGN